jgi:hypothetical protein
MRFFSRRRASSDSRRRQVRPELELLESRIVPSADKVLRVYPVGDLVAPIAQGSATSGFQGGLGGGFQAFGLGPPVEQLLASTASAEQSGWNTLQGKIQSANQWVSSTVDSFFAHFLHPQIPQIPPPQLLQVPSNFRLEGIFTNQSIGGIGGGNFDNFYNQETTNLMNLIKQVVVKPSGAPGGFGTQSLQGSSQGSLNGG